jgi:1-acyl-sn-glycerol-3-phosphate acyltransferase
VDAPWGAASQWDAAHQWAAGLDRLTGQLRRLAGDGPAPGDVFGFDPELTVELLLPALRPVWRAYFAGEVSGAEHIPASGAALVVGNHAGTFPLDGLLLALATYDEGAAPRHLRLLAADLLFRFPVVGDIARRFGVIRADRADAAALLAAGELVGVFPEGFSGTGKLYDERHQLQPFGRGGFAALAIRSGTPIVPVAIVGAEDSYPMLADLSPLARALGLPYFPITPTFPWLGPLGFLPLPAKWLIEFCEPVPTDGFGGPEAADDPAVVADLTAQVRDTVQLHVDKLVAQRGEPYR